MVNKLNNKYIQYELNEYSTYILKIVLKNNFLIKIIQIICSRKKPLHFRIHL